jgi:hypothetical protein
MLKFSKNIFFPNKKKCIVKDNSEYLENILFVVEKKNFKNN